MELGLSLGASSRPFCFMEKPREASNQSGLGFNFNFNASLSTGSVLTKQRDQHQHRHKEQEQIEKQKHKPNSDNTNEEDCEATNELLCPSLKANNKSVLQLDLLLHTPAVARMNPPPHLSFPWHPPFENAGSSSRGLDVNMLPAVATAENEAEEEAALSSSPNSAVSSIFQMDLCTLSRRGSGSAGEGYDQRGCSSKTSDEDENGVGDKTRKKLRLSKEQSAFLEESFREHSTLNPKQKIALAKQLHLRPRQVEVWFQNRRARTKLKQTEVDCEYLKKCCDTLKEENRRLQKELQELRALKTSTQFYMQLPATTLTMCPSCERVATNSKIDELQQTSEARFNPFHPTTPQHLELI